MHGSVLMSEPPFCLACVGTNNKFTAENVCLSWKYIYMGFEQVDSSLSKNQAVLL